MKFRLAGTANRKPTLKNGKRKQKPKSKQTEIEMETGEIIISIIIYLIGLRYMVLNNNNNSFQNIGMFFSFIDLSICIYHVKGN